jgi:hypothetical protein
VGKSFHVHINIQGALNEPPSTFKRNWDKVFTDGKTGRQLDWKEAREYLKIELLKGHRVIPSAGCDNFDYQTGCLGHENFESRGLQ